MTTKLIVFSDSHGVIQPMLNAIAVEKPHGIIHLGDCVRDTEKLTEQYPQLPLYRVRGNCDFDNWLCKDLLVRYDHGVCIFAAHGHKYNVKYGLQSIYMAGMEQEAQVILYGHTHVHHCEKLGDIWLMNPGAICNTHPTYGVITIAEEEAACCIRVI